jgi:hypothetical protein
MNYYYNDNESLKFLLQKQPRIRKCLARRRFIVETIFQPIPSLYL